MNSEKFCLKWNDFEKNISGAFKELRDDKDFFDVTLACDDEQIKAHKVIISACSPFFRSVLRTHPHQHPLLYMRGVTFSDLRAVLDFMYHGEVNVAQEDLNGFLAIAEDLKVKGLTQNQSASSNSGRVNSKPEVKTKPPDREVKRSRAPTLPEDDDIQEVLPIKTEPATGQADVYQQDTHHHHQQQQQHGQLQQFEEGAMEYGENYEDYGQYDETGQLVEGGGAVDTGKEAGTRHLNSCIEKYPEGGPRAHICKLCGKVSSDRSNLRKHVESIHYPNAFLHACKHCGQHFNTKNLLYMHVKISHKN